MILPKAKIRSFLPVAIYDMSLIPGLDTLFGTVNNSGPLSGIRFRRPQPQIAITRLSTRPEACREFPPGGNSNARWPWHPSAWRRTGSCNPAWRRCRWQPCARSASPRPTLPHRRTDPGARCTADAHQMGRVKNSINKT